MLCDILGASAKGNRWVAGKTSFDSQRSLSTERQIRTKSDDLWQNWFGMVSKSLANSVLE